MVGAGVVVVVVVVVVVDLVVLDVVSVEFISVGTPILNLLPSSFAPNRPFSGP